MFGIFGSPPFEDAQLGVLQRSRGKWRGTVDIDDGTVVPLVVSGNRRAPHAEAVRIARTLHVEFRSWRPMIERALLEHLEPYRDAVAAGELDAPSSGLPQVETSADVWSHVRIEYVAVIPLDGSLVVEFGIAAAWDDEHTLGARFRAGDFLELNGSVLAP